MDRWRLAVAAAVLVGCAAGAEPAAPPALPPPAHAFTAEVTRIVDGDTLWVEVVDPGASRLRDGAEVKLRLLRVDTPEVDRGGGPSDCLAAEATAALAALAPIGSTVLGVHDVEQRDRYERELVHLWTGEGTWINGALVAAGLAEVVTFRPNVAYEVEIRAAEAAARAADRGLHAPGGCPSPQP